MRGCPRATWGRRGTWGAPCWRGAGGAPAAQWGAWGAERPPRAQGLPRVCSSAPRWGHRGRLCPGEQPPPAAPGAVAPRGVLQPPHATRGAAAPWPLSRGSSSRGGEPGWGWGQLRPDGPRKALEGCERVCVPVSVHVCAWRSVTLPTAPPSSCAPTRGARVWHGNGWGTLEWGGGQTLRQHTKSSLPARGLWWAPTTPGAAGGAWLCPPMAPLSPGSGLGLLPFSSLGSGR